VIRVHFTAGDGYGWAIDEDLRQLRVGLSGIVQETSLADAQVVHAPFWMALAGISPEILADRHVIANADNPPFFYLKQPEFAMAQRQVDLWIARSREASEQFRALGLDGELINYSIDPGQFFPVEGGLDAKRGLRRALGIPEDAYVIANFHRDSEGADLGTPKLQKAPELMVIVLGRLRDAGANIHVLIAGPRRHWVRSQMAAERIPFTFVGDAQVPGDDFGVNILKRERLSELYSASDLYFVPSRWEGGPQSVMEAAASGCKVLSTHVGVARDLLEAECLFRTSDEAAAKILDDIKNRTLNRTTGPQRARFLANHTSEVMARGFRDLYARLEREIPAGKAQGTGRVKQMIHVIRQRVLPRTLPRIVRIDHETGRDADLDEIMRGVREVLHLLEIPEGASGPVLAGWPRGGDANIQFLSPGCAAPVCATSVVVAPAVQDVLNLRAAGNSHAAVVIPFVFGGEAGGGPLVIGTEDRGASLKVWKALLAGRAVLFPVSLAYGEQVFHAGRPFEAGEDLEALVRSAERSAAEFCKLSRSPGRKASAEALGKLLRLV